jgi:ppGpp synthetase/RelA/SpoT-type nucleotidyltranferase
VTVARDELEAAFEERKARYVRANTVIKETLNALLDDLSKRYGVREGLMVIGEAKGFKSFFKKATEKYDCQSVDEAFDRVRDLSRVRVLCHTLDDCYRLLRMLQEQQFLWVDPAKIEDRIASPTKTGYRAIHLEVIVDVPVGGEQVGVPVEVQIRTMLQEAWGFYTHGDFYKGIDVTPVIAKLMREFSDLLFWSDRHANLLVDEVAGARTERLAQGELMAEDGDVAAALEPPAADDEPVAGQPPAEADDEATE